MAKSRMINTRFWVDDYISNLDPIEKLLFLYFLTNPATDICGIYELPLKNVALDTGIEKEMVIKILARFERDNKIIYKNGWVAIKNFAKHQATNPKVLKGMEIGLAKAPKEILDSLSIAYDSLSHSNSNLNYNSNTKEADKSASLEISFAINLFKEINPSYKKLFGSPPQRKAVERLIETHGMEKLSKVIGLLQKTNTMTYMPTITTPVQLEDKWASLESNLIKRKVESEAKNEKHKVAF